MARVTVDYTLSADQLNASDGTPVTLWSHNYSSVYVPVMLQVWRAEGDAYVPAYTTQMLTTAGVTDSATGHFDDEVAAAPIAGLDLVIYDLVSNVYDDRTERGNVLFRIPIRDVLETTGANEMLILPEPGLVLRPGPNSYKIECPVGLGSGTGTLRLMITFEQVGF